METRSVSVERVKRSRHNVNERHMSEVSILLLRDRPDMKSWGEIVTHCTAYAPLHNPWRPPWKLKPALARKEFTSPVPS